MATGVFFYYQQGERLKDFPKRLSGLLEKNDLFMYDAFYLNKPESSYDLDPVSIELLQCVHTPEMVEQVKNNPDYDGALYSVAGTVAAAQRIFSSELTNAFVFTGFGDHHAGSDFYGGGCYFNGAAIAVHLLKTSFGVKRFSVIDTDAHHGDGSWELFEQDPDVLYLCFCSGPSGERNRNINIQVPIRTCDDEYFALAEEVFEKKVRPFRPEVIFWNWGYDGTAGDYGDIGISREFHVRMAERIKQLAEELCNGRLIVILCGGSRRDYASSIIPLLIGVLIGS